MCLRGLSPLLFRSLIMTPFPYVALPGSLAACRVSPDTALIPENASHSGEFSFVQGSNSCLSRAEETSEEVIRGYIGPCPPDKDHRYTLTVYALDCELDLQPGFYFNELHWALQGHILDSDELDVVSRA